jgi:hypothetical protein
MTHVVVGIHGVGTARRGSIAEAIRKNLLEGEISAEVLEFNWNSIAVQSLRGRNISWAAIREVACSLSEACLPIRSDCTQSNSQTLRSIRAVQEVAFQGAEVALAVLFTLFVLLIPQFVLIFNWWFWGSNFAASLEIARNLLGVTATIFLLALIFFVSVSCIMTVAAKDRSHFWLGIRRAVIIVFRPTILLFLTPFFIPWDGIFRKIWKVMTLVAVSILIFLFVNFVLSSVSGEVKMSLDFRAARQVVRYYVAVVGIMALLSAWAYWVLSPVMKVILDIFRYSVDSAGFRSILQNSLSELIDTVEASPDGCRTITIVAHSLGSVIAVDCLINSRCWRRTDSVTLITMGSPIKRFFFRFFPAVFFPANSSSCAGAIASRLKDFRWINCYRPWDQIGTSLGLPARPGLNDKSTKQFWRFITAHPNYWNDPTVRKALVEWVQANQWYESDSEFNIARGTYEPQKLKFKTTPVLVGTLAILSFVLAPVAGVFAQFRSWSKTNNHIDSSLNEIQTKGLQTTARVTCHRDTVYIYNGAITTDTFNFTFVDTAGMPRNVKSVVTWSFGDYDDDFRRFDPDRLYDYINSNPGKSPEIRIRYLSKDPSFIILPDFMWRPGMFSDLFSGVHFLFEGFLSMGLCVLIAAFSYPWLRLLIGRAGFSEADEDDSRRSGIETKV